MEIMSEEYKNRLKGLLRSLFQFDSADLDFGIYRIIYGKLSLPFIHITQGAK